MAENPLRSRSLIPPLSGSPHQKPMLPLPAQRSSVLRPPVISRVGRGSQDTQTWNANVHTYAP
jgi:hypothetical protein